MIASAIELDGDKYPTRAWTMTLFVSGPWNGSRFGVAQALPRGLLIDDLVQTLGPGHEPLGSEARTVEGIVLSRPPKRRLLIPRRRGRKRKSREPCREWQATLMRSGNQRVADLLSTASSGSALAPWRRLQGRGQVRDNEVGDRVLIDLHADTGQTRLHHAASPNRHGSDMRVSGSGIDPPEVLWLIEELEIPAARPQAGRRDRAGTSTLQIPQESGTHALHALKGPRLDNPKARAKLVWFPMRSC